MFYIIKKYYIINCYNLCVYFIMCVIFSLLNLLKYFEQILMNINISLQATIVNSNTCTTITRNNIL